MQCAALKLSLESSEVESHNVPKTEVNFVSIIKMQISEFEANISLTFYELMFQNHSYSFGPLLEISP